MYLGYFILSALDLISAVDETISHEERQGFIQWIYHCQRPDGGFRMWPGTDFGDRANAENVKWDPANVPATYFALCSLLILGDELQRVHKVATLQWLRRMQREDGSFGETLVDGKIEGGVDPRFAYCATGIRHILRSRRCRSADHGDVPDIDIQALIEGIAKKQSYDGGFADEAFHESHAGYTFCSLGALKLSGDDSESETTNNNGCKWDKSATIRWLSQRQTDLVYPDGEEDTEFRSASFSVKRQKLSIEESTDGEPLHQDVSMTIPPTKSEYLRPKDMKLAAGMNGRMNKVADTCYAWWTAASFGILEQIDLVNRHALRRYLLQLTQHPYMGGFSKFPGDTYADIYHSFMGLAALSVVSTDEQREEAGIQKWNATLCINDSTARWLDSALS
ncbi:hypothetical protein MRB53_042043 [Persea americana]|nr:hypothetical protein MRB53_042043 [Persea americana]